MNDKQRKLLFWVACIPTRLAIGILALYLTFNVNTPFAFILVGAVTSVITLGFLLNIVRAFHDPDRKGGLGGVIWWNETRIVHFAMYITCAITAFLRWPYSGVFIIADALLAIIFGVYHYFIQTL